MGLDELQAGNTLRAKATAATAFMRFLKVEEVGDEYVRKCIESDKSGRSFVAVMDNFGMYLAFNVGKSGKTLARNTAMQYYRQAKLWLLDAFPQYRAALETRLLKMGKTLDSFCLKRDGGGLACCSSDYQDATLVCLLWYLFGRASDLSSLRKRNISIDAANAFFVRFIRMKTSEEQGLSLFPDEDFATCPLLSVALALIVQAAPSPDLIENLPVQSAEATFTLSADVPLVELLDAPATDAILTAPAPLSTASAPTIYSHVNRILDRVAPAAGVALALTSHFFRRGGAQHANGCDELTARWIFDRGSWNMSTTNKGFNYIFNTSKEDHKIAKVLGGYKPDTSVKQQTLDEFDAETLDKIARVQHLLFAVCSNLETSSFNVNQRVLDVITASIFLYYPQLKRLNHDSPAVKRIESCVLHANCLLAELLAWSAHLAETPATCKASKQPSTPASTENTKPSQEQKIIDHQAAVIKDLVELAKRQDSRMDSLEAKLNNDPLKPTKKTQPARH